LLRELSLLRSHVAGLEKERAWRQRAERALRQYWNLLGCILDTSPDLFGLKGLDGRYQAASASFCHLTGKTEQEIHGRNDFELFPKSIAKVFQHNDTAVLQAGQPCTWESTIAWREGPLFLRFCKSPVFGAQGTCIGLLSIIRDSTAQRRAEEQNAIFRRIGQDGFWLLDIHGNILDVNQAYCEASGYGREDLIGKNLHDIEVLATPEDLSLRHRHIMEIGWDRGFKTLHHGKDNRIIEFEVSTNYAEVSGGRFYRFFREVPASRHLDPQPQPHRGADTAAPDLEHRWKVVHLNDVVHQALTLQAEILPPGIHIDLDLDPSLWNIEGNQSQLLQVLMNLLTNAVEAFEGRGRIAMSSRNVEMTEPLAQAFPEMRPGRYVYLAVVDNGRGISNKLIGKVFEPFITTKFRGRGMGLASAGRNVREHGGHITVRSREGQGSTFSVYLPATNLRVKPPSSCIQVPVGTETVLLVDSENYVLSETRDMLERLAYRVLVAHTAQEALAAARSYHGDIHLAVLDTRLPGDSGPDLLALLHALRPAMKIILTGAHDLNEAAQDLLDAGASTFVAKPLRVEVLAPKIRQTLDS